MAQTELTDLKHHENTILSILERSGTTLANVDLGHSLLFLLSTIIPDFTFGVLWKRQGGQYRRACVTTTEEDYKEHASTIIQSFNAAGIPGIHRMPDVIESARPVQKCLKRQISKLEVKTAFGARLIANYLILIPFAGGEELAEIYCKESIAADRLTHIEEVAQNICACLNKRLFGIYQVLLAKDEAFSDFREIQGNRRLFRQIFRDMRTWFGEDFRTVNIFAFDPQDRLLYHLETSHLTVNEVALRQYKPTPEISDPRILNHIEDKIDRSDWLGGIKPEVLKEILSHLRDKKKLKNKALKDDAKLLKALLTVMPQEPGTGIAGETALTRIPQLGLDTSDPRWQAHTEAYRGTFFAAMLPVEQIFGIGSSGNKMAAVPLTESGQLWGVLFFVQKEPYTSLRLLALWEKAQHLSSVLSLFRSFQFQNAIIRSAGNKPHVPVARLALENLHLAINPIFAIHWHLHGADDGQDRVECWQFDDDKRRFGPSASVDPKKRPFNNYDIKKQVHNRISKKKVEILDFSEQEEEAKIGLPHVSELNFPYRNLIRSVIMIPVPPHDLLAVYMDEEAKTLRPFHAQFEERFSCLWDVQDIRDNKVVDRVIITQSKKMEVPLSRALKIVHSAETKNINILVRGENGTGKELLARRIHMLSGRRGDFVAENINAIPSNLIESYLFGHLKGSFTGADKHRIGYFAKANGGTLLLDEIGDLPYELQTKLLRVIEERVYYPVGSSEPVEADVLLITATNQPLEELVEQGKFRRDLYYRLADFELELPPLRARREDIPVLARYFLSNNFPTKQLRLSASAMAGLLNFDWPGNVRELRNAIRQSGTYLDEGKNVISLEDIARPKEIHTATGIATAQNIKKYVGLEDIEDDGCRGWALFAEDETYGADEAPEDDWSHMALSAFDRLKDAGVKVDTYCSMGCGAALDAIIAVNTWECKRVLLGDINENALAIAQENVYLNAPHTVEVTCIAGNLFQNFVEEKYDLIYENLPNLPWASLEPLDGIKLATFCQPYKDSSLPAEEWRLTTHEQFLKQAGHFLEPDGRVVCCIGARVPWEVVNKMFHLQGYTTELIYYGIKKQQQPHDVVEGYAKAEEGKEEPFTFLDLKLARELLGRIKTDNQPTSLRKIVESITFSRARLTAKEALQEIQKGAGGKIIGHGVYVVSGRRRNN